jgi:tRNA pseudouridine32 synthase/23S rRNA pseudouridine746 synthase
MLAPMTELDLLHVDEALLVVNKPAGVLSVPGKGDGQRHNLTSWLQHRFADALVVHRLDQATSGLILFARRPDVQRSLSMAFERRQVHKQYEAVVMGLVAEDEGVIDAPLAADWPQRPRQVVDFERGKPSTTRWRVLQRHAHTTRLQLEPVTGRSHQLRVHLLSVGHPIVGDSLYDPASDLASNRLMLHATLLRLFHPVSQAELVFRSTAPF